MKPVHYIAKTCGHDYLGTFLLHFASLSMIQNSKQGPILENRNVYKKHHKQKLKGFQCQAVT